MSIVRIASIVLVASACVPAAVASDQACGTDGLGIRPTVVPAIAPHLDEQAFAVAHIDLARIDLAAAAGLLIDVLRPTEEQRTGLIELRKRFESWKQLLQAAGVRDLFISVDLFELVQAGHIHALVPVTEGADPRAIAAVMSQLRFDRPAPRPGEPPAEDIVPGEPRLPRVVEFETCEPLGNVVFCGDRETLARLRKHDPVDRPELAAAFEAAGDAAVRLLIVPTEVHRRVLRELGPPFPGETEAAGGTLADGLRWAAVAIDAPPKPALRLVVQSQDAAAARALRDLLMRSVRRLTQDEDVRDRFPAAETLVQLFAPQVEGDRLLLTLDADRPEIRRLFALAASPLVQATAVARGHQCRNNLKQLGLAMHNFHDVYGSFPPSASYDDDGKPLLSWRVFLLPYLGQEELYRQFRLDEPWNSEHNKKLIEKMPAVFACPAADLKPGSTTYLAPLADETIFFGPEGRTIRQITDGTSNTILLVDADADHAVIWTKPEDLPIDLDKPHQGLTGNHEGGFHATFADGSVRLVPKDIEAKTLRALFTKAGGEPVNF